MAHETEYHPFTEELIEHITQPTWEPTWEDVANHNTELLKDYVT